MKDVMMLRQNGYDVELLYNEVSEESSIMRVASLFAETGRFLFSDYLTTIKSKPTETFRNFAELKVSDYERVEREVQQLQGRSERVPGTEEVPGTGLRELPTDQRGRGTLDETVQESVGTGGVQASGNQLVNGNEPIFSYAEWKSNDVAFGEKPKEIWNSKCGKPMPGKKEETKNEGKQEIPGESSPSGEGERQEGRGSERPGAERGPEQNRAERSGCGYSVGNTQGVCHWDR